MWDSTVGGIVILILSLLTAPHATEAQQQGKVPRVGFLGDGSAATRAAQTLEPLRELGYVEGQNILLEVQWTDGHSERLPELNGKMVQLLTEMLPGLTGVAVLWNRLNPGATLQAEAVQGAAREVGLQVSALAVQSLEEIAEALATAAVRHVGAVIVVGDPLTTEHRTRIAQLALHARLPVIATGAARSSVEAGALMSYGPELASRFKRAAVFVDKILKGAKPADLPVEQPTTFELVINLKTAEALGLTMPPRLLFQADVVLR